MLHVLRQLNFEVVKEGQILYFFSGSKRVGCKPAFKRFASQEMSREMIGYPTSQVSELYLAGPDMDKIWKINEGSL